MKQAGLGCESAFIFSDPDPAAFLYADPDPAQKITLGRVSCSGKKQKKGCLKEKTMKLVQIYLNFFFYKITMITGTNFLVFFCRYFSILLSWSRIRIHSPWKQAF